jgi:hypothetical protein
MNVTYSPVSYLRRRLKTVKSEEVTIGISHINQLLINVMNALKAFINIQFKFNRILIYERTRCIYYLDSSSV